MEPVAAEVPVKEVAVEKVAEDQENTPFVPTDAVDEVKAPVEAAPEEEPKQTESEPEKTETAEEKSEELPPVENGNGEAEAVSVEEPEVAAAAVDESTLKRKVDDEVKEDEEKIPEKKCKTGDTEEKKEEEAVEKTAEKPVAEPEAVTEQEATA